MVKLVALTRDKFALVDEQDLSLVSRFKWHFGNGYARNMKGPAGTQRCRLMHRLITNCPPGSHVDHINGDGLDNRRENLRIATPSQNLANSKLSKLNRFGLKGVTKWRNRYRAKVCVQGRQYHLGYFDTPEAAARAYDEAAERLNGEFAKTNFGGAS